MANWFSEKFAAGKKEWRKYRNTAFKKASMAIAARIANAHGGVDQSEKDDVAAVIGGIPELADFDPVEMFSLFEGYCTQLAKGAIGKIVTARDIAGIKGNAGAIAAALQIGLMIANSDGEFQEEEQTEFKQICGDLGVDPKPYLPEPKAKK